VIDVCGREEPVFAVAFNGRLREYMACTNGDCVKVYELGERFSNPRWNEQKILDKLSEADSGGDVQNIVGLH
ncbi:hypothetical protein CYMTET_50739, partial [Cymbomonas tetramitiformis]